jgi:hypothetical protein
MFTNTTSTHIEHIKWLAYMPVPSSAELPGFDTHEGYVLSFEAKFSAEMYGVNDNPFGDMVVKDSPALANAMFLVTDFMTGWCFGFWLTNDKIYAAYEHLPRGRTPENNSLRRSRT